MSEKQLVTLDCDGARAAWQELLDGAPGEWDRKALEAHLQRCPECSAFCRDIDGLRSQLVRLPRLRLPEAALDELWAKTVEAPSSRSAHRRPGLARPLALAASLVLAVAMLGVLLDPVRGPVKDAERARMDAEVHEVLALVSRTLHDSRRIALEEIAAETAPALRVLPIERDVGTREQ